MKPETVHPSYSAEDAVTRARHLLARHRQQAIAQHEGGRGEVVAKLLADGMTVQGYDGEPNSFIPNQLSQSAAQIIAQQAEEVRDLNKRLAVAYARQMGAEEEVARLREAWSATAEAAATHLKDRMRADADNKYLREAALGSTAGLAAALSVLQRANSQHVEPCKAVASDKMFAQMMTDYQKRLDASRAALNEQQQDCFPKLIESTRKADYYQMGPERFQAFKPGAKPIDNGSGYYNLQAIKRLKGDGVCRNDCP